MTEEETADAAARADEAMPSHAPRTRRFLVILGLCIAFALAALAGARAIFGRRPPGRWEKKAWPSGPVPVPVAHYSEATPENITDVLAGAKPGDTIMLAPGDYSSPGAISLNGAPGAPITLKAEGGAIFKPGLSVTKSSWLILDGLIIDGAGLSAKDRSGRMGLMISECGYCVLRRLTIRGIPGRYGIYGNNLHHTIIEDSNVSHIATGHGICVFGASSDLIIRRNRVYDCASCGIYVDAYTVPGAAVTHVLAEANTIARTGAEGGAAFNCSNVVQSCFRNNLVYDNFAGAICFYKSPQDPAVTSALRAARPRPRIPSALLNRILDRILNRPSPDCANNVVLGNTVYFPPGQGRWSFKLRDESTGFMVHNNIFVGGSYGTVSISRESLAGLAMDYNLITTHPGQVLLGEHYTADNEPTFEYTVGSWQATGCDAHSLFDRDPAFHAAQQGDFRLDRNSPAIDAGKRLHRWLHYDIDGLTRDRGDSPDCGAFEYPTP